jgi:hypothetical protein
MTSGQSNPSFIFDCRLPWRHKLFLVGQHETVPGYCFVYITAQELPSLPSALL